MARIRGPRKINQYSAEFKLKAVKLSQIKGVQVQDVADALDVHPFMLSRWRKEVREGHIRARVAIAPEARRQQEVKQLAEVKRQYALLKEEHELLKKPSGSVPRKDNDLRVHRRAAGPVRCEGTV
jgi:transposase